MRAKSPENAGAAVAIFAGVRGCSRELGPQRDRRSRQSGPQEGRRGKIAVASEVLLVEVLGEALLPVLESGRQHLDLLEAHCHSLREVNEDIIERTTGPDGSCA